MDNDSSVKVLVKAMDIIEIISQENRGLNLGEISKRTGLNKSTVHRILSTMLDRQFIEHGEDGLYRIGGRLLQVLSGYVSNLELQTEARAPLRQLSNRLHLSAILAVFVEGQSILVEKLEFVPDYGNFQLLGQRPPVYCTAHGKCLLAYLSSAVLEYKLDQIQFTAYTSHTITSRKTLLTELHKIRKQGYAMDYEENEYNQCCIAAPIFDYRGEAIAAITVSGTCTQIEKERVPEVGHEVVLAARKVSERMGYYSEY